MFLITICDLLLRIINKKCSGEEAMSIDHFSKWFTDAIYNWVRIKIYKLNLKFWYLQILTIKSN